MIQNKLSVIEENFFDLLKVLCNKDAVITVKAMDVNGEWVAAADVPTAFFKRERGIYSFTNAERIAFPPIEGEQVCVLFLGVFYEGKLKLVISCDAEVVVSAGYALCLLPGDLRISC